MEFTPPQDPQSPPDQRKSRVRHDHHRPTATMLREYADLGTSAIPQTHRLDHLK
jgi:hypothetical protein